MKKGINLLYSQNPTPNEKVMVPIQKRVRPWKRMGFRNKREFMLMKKRIHNLIWKDRV